MKMIILYAQHQIGEDRSVFGLYHMLQGRSSIQTIQDVKLYRLQGLYGIYRHLKRKRFAEIVEYLYENGYLQHMEPDYYPLTRKGQTWLANQASIFDHLYLNGEKYGQQDKVFFQRIQLLVQVWTNMKKGNHHFIPVIEDRETVNWVRHFYQRTKTKLDTYLFHLHQELQELFCDLPDIYPEIFLAQLSSYHHIGETTEQLAIDHQLWKEDVDLMTTNVLHYILYCVQNAKEHYPVLHTLVRQLHQETNLTNSAAVTANYLARGAAVEEIARKRSLKANTVYDHIVELAVHQHPAIVIHHYITDKDIKKIEQAVVESGSYRLKVIKDAVGEHLSYFQIRLALAMMQQPTSWKRGE